MSIGVGFRCTDGVVLAADSEHTIGDSKFIARKAWYLRFPDGKNPRLRIGVVGAGSTDTLESFVSAVRGSLTPPAPQGTAEARLDASQTKLEQQLLEFYTQHVYARPIEDQPKAEFECLVAMRIGNTTRLLRTSDTTAHEIETYDAVGLGHSLFRSVVNGVDVKKLTVAGGILLATRILLRAKAYVQDCGGPTKMVVVYNAKDSGYVTNAYISECESYVKDVDGLFRPILLSGLDSSDDPAVFAAQLGRFSNQLTTLRSQSLQNLSERLTRAVKKTRAEESPQQSPAAAPVWPPTDFSPVAPSAAPPEDEDQ